MAARSVDSGRAVTLASGVQQDPSHAPERSGWQRLAVHAVPLASFAGAALGCYATLQLCALGAPPGLASAGATLLLCAALITTPTRHLLPTTFSSSTYGGSFSGMTSLAALGDSVARTGLPVDGAFMLLSLFTGLVFCLVCVIEVRLRQVLLKGYGGRFGALAAVGSFVFLTLGPWLAQGTPLHLARLDQFDKGFGDSLAIFAMGMAGAVVTMVVLRSPDIAGTGRAARVFASAAVAFVGLAMLQQIPSADRCLADAYYAGCFLGMSSPQRLRGWFQPVAAAATLTVLLVQAATILPSVGGSLGFAAFIAVVGVDAARRLGDAMPPTYRPVLAGLGRSLAVVLTVAGLLLPNDVFHARREIETTGAIPREAAPAAAPAAAPPSDAPALETPAAAPVQPEPPSVMPSPVVVPPAPWPSIPPPRAEAPRPRRASRPVGGVQPSTTDPAPRRSNRVVPNARPTPPAAAPAPVPQQPVRRAPAGRPRPASPPSAQRISEGTAASEPAVRE